MIKKKNFFSSLIDLFTFFFFIQSAYLEYTKGTNFCVACTYNDINYFTYRSIYVKRAVNVAAIVAYTLIRLKRNEVFNVYKDIILVGFSAGTHLAGMIGRSVKSETKNKIGIIFGNLNDLTVKFSKIIN